MKAMLYKTFDINVGSTLPSFIIAILFCYPLPMPWLDMTCVFFLILSTLPLCFLFHRERRDRWYELAPTFPFSPKAIVGEKYLLSFLFILPLPFLMCLGLHLDFVGAVPPPFPVAFRAVAMMLVFSACFLFLTFWLGPKRMLLFYLPLLALFFALDLLCLYEKGCLLVYLPLPILPSLAVAVVFFLLSYRAAVGRYHHRTW